MLSSIMPSSGSESGCDSRIDARWWRWVDRESWWGLMGCDAVWVVFGGRAMGWWMWEAFLWDDDVLGKEWSGSGCSLFGVVGLVEKVETKDVLPAHSKVVLYCGDRF